MRDYLAGVAPPGRLPGRQHIDPVDFPTLLPFVNLVDVEREQGEGEQGARDAGRMRFRYRLVGTINAARDGIEVEMLLSLFAYPGDADTRPVALPPPRTP